MRTRDEVLREFKLNPDEYGYDGYHNRIERMADRIRELEAQLSDEGLRTIGEKNARFFTRSDEAASEQDKSVLEHLEWLCNHAYEHGCHELGYNPVEYVRNRLTASEGANDA